MCMRSLRRYNRIHFSVTTLATRMVTVLGSVSVLDADQEDWTAHIKRVEHFFVANNVANEARIPTLIALMGNQTYGLLKSLTIPTKPRTLSFKEIVHILQDHLTPKPLVIAERLRFHKRKQGLDVDVSTYVPALRKLTQHCEFGTFLDDALRDRFVCGLQSTHIQKRLLSQAKLTFKTGLKTAIAMTAAAKDTRQMTTPTLLATTSAIEEVHQMPDKQSIRKQGTKFCYRCNSPSQLAFACCPLKTVCTSCEKKGHLAAVCRSKPYKSTPATQTE